MYHGIVCHSSGFLGYAHVPKLNAIFVSLEYRTFHEILLLMFLVTQVLFLYTFSVMSEIDTVEHIEHVVHSL